jgi:hypothetical protein
LFLPDFIESALSCKNLNNPSTSTNSGRGITLSFSSRKTYVAVPQAK